MAQRAPGGVQGSFLSISDDTIGELMQAEQADLRLSTPEESGRKSMAAYGVAW
jgi:hypothetical protein